MAKRKTRTAQPRHGGDEVKVRLSIDLDEALYLGGIWVSPGEEAFVPKADAGKLVKGRKAELLAEPRPADDEGRGTIA